MSASSKIVLLQVAIVGYTSEGVTLYGAIDTERGALMIDKDGGPRDPVRAGFIKASNIQTDAHIVFKDEDLREAIEAYRQMDASKTLRFGDKVARHNPSGRLQVQRIGETGPIYEIGADITNGQVAGLVMAWLAKRQMGHASVAAFTDRIATQLYKLEIY